ncbi:unnamed protein product, partial [marine sediment metagenome]
DPSSASETGRTGYDTGRSLSLYVAMGFFPDHPVP